MCRLCSSRVVSLLALVTGACTDVTAPSSHDEITITPSDTTILLLGPGGGQQLQYTASARSRSGSMTVLSNVTWRSSAPEILSVSASGVAVARALGVAILIARVGATSDSAWVLVRSVPVASLSIALDSIAVQVGPYGGSTRTLSAVVRDSAGFRLSEEDVRWRSSDSTIATVTPRGVLTAVGIGKAWAHASAGRQQDSSIVIVTPTLGPASGVAVRILGALWTQGVQRSDGSIPMISGGRAAVVNVMTSATGAIAAPMQFVLRLFDAGGIAIHSDTTSASILSGSTTLREPTLQFLVPSLLLRAGVRWDVVRDPQQLSPGGAEGAEAFPAAGHTRLHLVTPSPLKIRFVPIVLAAHRDVRGEVTTALLGYYTQTVRAFFPHGPLEATIASAHRTFIPFGIAGYGGAESFWSALVVELDTRRVADPEHADAYWIGVVRPPSGFSYSTIGGMGYIPTDGQSYGPGTRTSAVIGANWSASDAHSRDLVAHELGHNLGRLHAPCGTDGMVDASFPNARGAIGDGAHDTFAWERGLAAGAAAVHDGTADFMGYCAPLWISAHTYDGMLSFRESPALALRALSVRQRVLLVRGVVERGVVRLDVPSTIEAEPSLPVGASAWALEGRATDGAVVLRWPFALARWDHAPQTQPFAFAVPWNRERELRVVAVRVTGPLGSSAWRAP